MAKQPDNTTVVAPSAPRKQNSLNRVRLRFKEQEYFIENLALLLKAGVSVGDALQSLAESMQGTRLRRKIMDIRADIEAGMSMADALEQAHLVGSQTLALVRLGEVSGHLVGNLELAARQEAKQHTFRAKVRSALIYPAFVLSLTVIVGLGVAWFLLPRLSTTFSDLRVKLPLLSRIMIHFGIFLRAHGVVVVPLTVLALAGMGYALFAAPHTKQIGQRLLFRVPGVGRLMREVEVAQFGYLLGTLLEAGLPVTQAVLLLSRATTTPEYRKFYTYLARSIDEGHSFREGLAAYKTSASLLPRAVQQMMVAGERSGSLGEVLTIIGNSYEEKANVTTSNLETIIEPVLLVIVWLGVLMVAVSVIVPVYSLVGGLNK